MVKSNCLPSMYLIFLNIVMSSSTSCTLFNIEKNHIKKVEYPSQIQTCTKL